jgi:glycosyltransferase involved in cell wall biosynthesis
MQSTSIVLLSAFLSPYRSGAESMVEEVSKRLASRYSITIVTARLSRNLPHRDSLGDVEVRRIGVGLPIDKYLFPFLAPFAVARLCPAIVHAVLESYAGLALFFVRFLIPRTKRILTLQSTNTSLLLGPIHRSAHAMTAISRALVERAKRFTPTPVSLIPNGIDLAAIREACSFHPKDSGCVLFVGRLEPMKGVDTLLRAFMKAIIGVSPEVHLRIVGDGSQRRALEMLSKELEIDHRVTFVGRIGAKAVLDEYAKAEIFCGFSRSEALGNVFLEAQASGCAVLATRTGGIPEIVHDDQTGLLVTPDDIEAASQALRSLLLDAPLRARLSSAAKSAVTTYDWDTVAKRYAQVYDAI